MQSSNQQTESGSDPNSNWLARLDESIAAFNQRFILNLWNQGSEWTNYLYTVYIFHGSSVIPDRLEIFRPK
jgi:hypothetical protein